MAAATVASGYPKVFNNGDTALYVWQLTTLLDTNTLATGLSNRYIDHWVSWTGNPATQASAGGHSAYSAGTITFYPSTDSLGASVFVLARGA